MKQVWVKGLLVVFSAMIAGGSAQAQQQAYNLNIPTAGFPSSYSNALPGLYVSNASGDAIYGYSGTGYGIHGCSTKVAGYFELLSGSLGNGLDAFIDSSASGNAVYAVNHGSGTAISGVIDNSQNSGNAINGSTSGTGAGVFGAATNTTTGIPVINAGVYGYSSVSGGYGVYATSNVDNGFALYSTTTKNSYAGYFKSSGTATTKGTLYSYSSGSADSVVALSDGSGIGVHSVADTSSGQAGVFQNSNTGTGNSLPAISVNTLSSNLNASAAYFQSGSEISNLGYDQNNHAILTAPTIKVTNYATGVLAQNPPYFNPGYPAAEFDGSVNILGNLTKGGGSFLIDDPVDPDNKVLYHSFVESPDMKNIYDGIVTTDTNGNATITLPTYFDTLNRDFRYQLTIIGGQFAQAIVTNEIQNDQFSIKTNLPNIKVSWQVTGIRQDAYANAHRIPEEVEKSNADKGRYLYPLELGKPIETGMTYVAPQGAMVPAVPPDPTTSSQTVQSQSSGVHKSLPAGDKNRSPAKKGNTTGTAR